MSTEPDNPNKRRRQDAPAPPPPPPPPPPQPAPVLSRQAVAAAAAAEAAIRILEREAAAASAALVVALNAAGEGDDDDEDNGNLWVGQVELLDSLLLDLRQHRAEAEAAPDDQVHGPAGAAAPTYAEGEAGVGVAVTVERMARAALNGDLGELILQSERRLRLLAYAAGSGFTPMTAAASRGFFEMTRFLLDTGVAVNQLDGHGASPLFHAALGGHESIVKLLLHAGADPTATGHMPTGANALQAAAAGGGVWAVQAMLAHGDAGEQRQQQGGEGNGAFIDRGDKGGRTALWLAAVTGHAAVVNCLIGRGADPLIPDASGKLPREAAAAAGHAGCVALLDGAEKRYLLLQARAFVSAELRAGLKPTTTATATTTNGTAALPAWAQRRLAAGRPLPRVDVLATDAAAATEREGAVLDWVVRGLPSEIFVELVEAIGATFGTASA